jgi:hypothetical protein
MPGILPHLIAGCVMSIIGRYYYNSYFKGDNKTNKLLILIVVCISFSFLPDIFLGIHYTIHIFSRCTMMPYHVFIHTALIPISIVALSVIYLINPKNKPIYIVGFWAIILHLLMDFFINTRGLLI